MGCSLTTTCIHAISQQRTGVLDYGALQRAIIDPHAETIMQKKLGIRKGKRLKAFPSLFDEESVRSLVPALKDFAR